MITISSVRICRSPTAASAVALAVALAVAGCSSSDGGNGPPPPPNLSSCTATNTIPMSLAVGEFRIVDALHQSNCVSLPGGASASEYVVVAYSGYGVSTFDGTSAPFALQSVASTPGGSADFSGLPFDRPAQPGSARARATTPAAFDRHLRQLEAQLVAGGGGSLGTGLIQPVPPPVVGDRDSFNVCSDRDCNSFDKVGATVRFVGTHAVIYLDDHQLGGAEAFTPGDLEELGRQFDDYMYPIDTTAFGRESDINSDGHIAILVTPAVNNLTPDCTDGRIVGYSFSGDLVGYAKGSNHREMFYVFAPAPATGKCRAVTRSLALTALPSTLIHEFQHMISFNQHVLLRGGGINRPGSTKV